QHYCLVPKGDYEIDDDWDVMGLKGTGSKSVKVKDALVPSHRTLSLPLIYSGNAPGLGVNSAPIFKVPLRPLFGYTFVPAAIGAAVRAVEELRRHSYRRRNAFSGTQRRKDPFAWQSIAHASSCIDLARLMMRRDL